MANITLNTKVYGGRGVIDRVASWMNQASGILAGFASLTGFVKLPQRKEERVNIQWRLRIPVIATDPSACACPGAVVDEIDCYIQIRATQGVSPAVRTDLALQVKDLTASTEFQQSVINFLQPTG